MRAVAEKPHDAVVKFDTYQNIQRHRAVLPPIARLLLKKSPQQQENSNTMSSDGRSVHDQKTDI